MPFHIVYAHLSSMYVYRCNLVSKISVPVSVSIRNTYIKTITVRRILRKRYRQKKKLIVKWKCHIGFDRSWNPLQHDYQVTFYIQFTIHYLSRFQNQFLSYLFFSSFFFIKCLYFIYNVLSTMYWHTKYSQFSR